LYNPKIETCINRGQNGKTSYLDSSLAKRPNYEVLQNAERQNVKHFISLQNEIQQANVYVINKL